MSKNKTTETENSVAGFISKIDETRQNDAKKLVELFQKQTGFAPKMWGPAIIGFGRYHYRYESGREGDAPLSGFSPRKDLFALYLSANFEKRDILLEKLGKHKTGKSCVYFKKIDDIDTDVLKEMISASAKHVRNLYPD